MSRKAMDWARIEAEYVTGEYSMREIGRRFEINVSTVSREAKKGGWDAKRDAYRNSLSSKAYDLMADSGAVDLAKRNMAMLKIADQVFGLVEKQVPVWEEQIAAGKTPISVREFDLISKLVRVIIGQPTARTEERKGVLNLHAFQGLDNDAIERIERASRLRLVEPGGSQRSAGPDSEVSGAE